MAWAEILLGAFAALAGFPAGAAAFDTAATDPRWLRLYQYETAVLGGVRSDVVSPKFFFSPEGPRNPRAEMRAAIAAYSDPNLRFGTQNQPAACVFPLRKLVLEELLGREFPSPDCPDLASWVERIGADRISLVFVGAYAGNPASILGHSFLRFSNSRRESSGRAGSDLLSYAVGFTAQTDPRDGRMTYMFKGVTGGYPGSYEIEPHYMKVGLYNNSESRDLWEVQLNLTPEEVRRSVLHLWEVTFNAQIPYYFIDENCADRLLRFLEVVRPELSERRDFRWVVLPAETVRSAIAMGLGTPRSRFRSSLRRRLEARQARFTKGESRLFAAALTSVSETRRLENRDVLEALMDHWLIENYAAETHLESPRKELMDAAFAQRAELPAGATYELTDAEIEKDHGLRPPFLSHKPRWVEIRGGSSESRAFGALTYRSGVHPFWSGDPGYADVTGIEYLGADLEFRDGDDVRWDLLVIQARSFESAFGRPSRWSWAFEAKAESECDLCGTDRPVVRLGGGFGVAQKWAARTLAFLIGHVRLETWEADGWQGMAAPGLLAGGKWANEKWSFVFEGSRHWWRERAEWRWESRLTRTVSPQTQVFARWERTETTAGFGRSNATLGLVRFFD